MYGCSPAQGHRAEPHLLVFGEASHDGGVHDPIKQHGQRVDGEAVIALVLIDHRQDLLVGCGHGLDSVLQGANCDLQKTVSPQQRGFKNRTIATDFTWAGNSTEALLRGAAVAMVVSSWSIWGTGWLFA